MSVNLIKSLYSYLVFEYCLHRLVNPSIISNINMFTETGNFNYSSLDPILLFADSKQKCFFFHIKEKKIDKKNVRKLTIAFINWCVENWIIEQQRMAGRCISSCQLSINKIWCFRTIEIELHRCIVKRCKTNVIQ